MTESRVGSLRWLVCVNRNSEISKALGEVYKLFLLTFTVDIIYFHLYCGIKLLAKQGNLVQYQRERSFCLSLSRRLIHLKENAHTDEYFNQAFVLKCNELYVFIIFCHRFELKHLELVFFCSIYKIPLSTPQPHYEKQQSPFIFLIESDYITDFIHLLINKKSLCCQQIKKLSPAVAYFILLEKHWLAILIFVEQ